MPFTAGTEGRTGGWNDQNCLSLSETAVNAGNGSGPGAPCAIHALIFAVSASVGSSTANSFAIFSGGICPLKIREYIELASGFPGTSAGPDFPPFNRLAIVRRSNPPFWFNPPWQVTHRACKIPRTSCSETRATVSTGGSLSTHPRITSISASLNFALPGGICPVTILSIKKLFAALPATIAGPDAPPFSAASSVRRSNFPCAAAPWQPAHLALKTGPADASKFCPAAARARVKSRKEVRTLPALYRVNVPRNRTTPSPSAPTCAHPQSPALRTLPRQKSPKTAHPNSPPPPTPLRSPSG